MPHGQYEFEDPDDPEAILAELTAASEAMQAFEDAHLLADGTFGQLNIGDAHELARLQQRLATARARRERIALD
jgi:hypothetical protein